MADNVVIELLDTKPITDLVTKVKIRVCGVDQTGGNGFTITEDFARKLASELPCAPIVGYFNGTDFESHNYKFDNYGEMTTNTKPYGFVSPMDAPYIEDIDGEKYVTCYGFLWTKQWEEAKLAAQGKPQSMEIAKVESESTLSGNEVILDGEFRALCILGDDRTPAFSKAYIETFEAKSELEIKDVIEQFMSLFESIINEQKGDTNLTEVKNGAPLTSADGPSKIGVSEAFESEVATTNVQTTETHVFAVEKFMVNDAVIQQCTQAGFLDENSYIYGFYTETNEQYIILQQKMTGKLFKVNYNIDYTQNQIIIGTRQTEVEIRFLPAGQASLFEGETSTETATTETPTFDGEATTPSVTVSALVTSLEAENATLKDQLAKMTEEFDALKGQVEMEKKQELVDEFTLLTNEEKAEIDISATTFEALKATLALKYTEKQLFEAKNKKEISVVPTVVFNAGELDDSSFLKTASQYMETFNFNKGE